MQTDHNLASLADLKAKEWREIEERRVAQLSDALDKANGELEALKGRYKQLKDDFKYNLSLLDARDGELSQFDRVYAELRQLVAAKDGEVSELKIAVDKATADLAREAARTTDIDSHYQLKLRGHQEEMARWKVAKELEMNTVLDESHGKRIELECQLRVANEQLAEIRTELSVEFERASQQASRELREQVIEAERRAADSGGRSKQLGRELELVTQRCDELQAELDLTAAARLTAEAKQKEGEWALKDREHEKEAQAIDFSWQLEHERSKLSKTVAGLERKMEVLTHGFEHAEAAAEGRVQAAQQREADAKELVRLVRQETEDALSSQQASDNRHAQEVQVLKAQLASHSTNLAKLLESSRQTQAEYAHSLSARDTELRAMSERHARQKAQHDDMEQQYQECTRQMAAGLEREADLKQQSSAQVTLLEREIADLKAAAAKKDHQIVQRVSGERDRLFTQLEMAQQEIIQHKAVLTRLQVGKDEALQLVAQWRQRVGGGPGQGGTETTDGGIGVDSNSEGAALHLGTLQEENSSLRAVIKQMRREMEGLAADTTAPGSADAAKLPAHVQELNQEVRRLRLQVRESAAATRDAQAQAAHAAALNGGDISKPPAALEREHHAIVLRQHEAKAAEAGRRVEQVQQELAASREQCVKALAAVQRKLSGGIEVCKGEAACPPGVQSVLLDAAHLCGTTIQAVAKQHGVGPGSSPASVSCSTMLRNKLQEAVRDIERLTREKQQLLDISNQLRGEIAKSTQLASTPKGRQPGPFAASAQPATGGASEAGAAPATNIAAAATATATANARASSDLNGGTTPGLSAAALRARHTSMSSDLMRQSLGSSIDSEALQNVFKLLQTSAADISDFDASLSFGNASGIFNSHGTGSSSTNGGSGATAMAMQGARVQLSERGTAALQSASASARATDGQLEAAEKLKQPHTSKPAIRNYAHR